MAASLASGTIPPNTKFIEAAALLSHVQMKEGGLPDTEHHFGHPPPPMLQMCRIPNPEIDNIDLEVVVLIAYTRRCVSAQVLKESIHFSATGAPVEVLVVPNGERIDCATVISLEQQHLSADDTVVIPDRSNNNTHHYGSSGGGSGGTSLMSGGLLGVAPPPRVAIVVGTSYSRIMSVEFAVRPKSMQLVRKNLIIDQEIGNYLEPIPINFLTPHQQSRLDKRMLDNNNKGHPNSNNKSNNGGGASGGGGGGGGGELNKNNLKRRPILPFTPSGGVTSIAPVSLGDVKKNSHVWISWGDGTTVRLHHAGFFPSVIQKHHDSKPGTKTLEDLLDDPVVSCQLQLPRLIDTTAIVIPLPKYHPSPMAPFPTWKRPELDDLQDDTNDKEGNTNNNNNNNNSNDGGDTQQKQKHEMPEIYEAILYCTGAMVDSFPTLTFYTSEDQFEGRIHGDILDEPAQSNSFVIDTVLGGAGKLFGGMMGGFLMGSSKRNVSSNDEMVKSTNEPKPDVAAKWNPRVPFPSINLDPIRLFAGYESHDPPRRVTFCTVDPEGDLAAAADTLGRVSLVDLSTKQVIRMWKGYRDTYCYWAQIPRRNREQPWQKSKVLYLVIHCRQRRVIEVWQTRHGPRVKSMQVGREAQILCCRELSDQGYISSCYLAHSNVPFTSMNQVEKIVIEQKQDTLNERQKNRVASKKVDPAKLAQEAAVRLNHLQQLLGNTNVPSQSVDVYKALTNIKSLKDLSTALDLLSVAPALEEKMSVEGSAFQRLAVSFCMERLEETIREAGDDAVTNPHVQLLAFKVAYYSQIVAAYEVLHNFEMGNAEEADENENVARTDWITEAFGWTSTYEKITGESIDTSVNRSPTSTLKFFIFSAACVAPKNWLEAPPSKDGVYSIYMSDSSRTRGDLLIHIFRPLLGDVFSYNIVNQVFECLGIHEDYEYLLKCFGEWFMSLSVKEATRKSLFSLQSPTGRWLLEVVGHQLEKLKAGTATPTLSDDNETQIVFKALHDFCMEATDLVRAFWLATLCREAISEAAKDSEEETYGQISSYEMIEVWDTLLRKLRVSLLVSLRLHGISLGVCPLSVKAVDEDGNFSFFQWLAHDELAMSHNHEEIVTLEKACKISSRSFDPSCDEGDDPARVKILQDSCLAAALSEDERAEYLVDFDDDDRLGALLLYISPYNEAEFLVAHRALLLASEWGRHPEKLDVLGDALVALKETAKGKQVSISAAVRLEVWQSRIRPVYRALLMGFDDVQEISAEVVAPLFHDTDWVKAFGKLAAEILALLTEVKWTAPGINELEAHIKFEVETWPPVRKDFLLDRYIQRNREPDSTALDAHRILVAALLVSTDIPTLSQCIPAFYDLFLPNALFTSVGPVDEADEKQHSFLQDAIVARARDYSGPGLDTLDLGEIDTLALLWDFDLKNVKTLFLLSMYEYGKDRAVDELLTKCAPFISAQHFCEDGVDIVCRRLHELLHVSPNDKVSKVMGTLDAEMCEWIRDRAEDSQPLVNGDLYVPVGDTHLFALRLLSLAASTDISKEERIKIHSLIVLSGSLVKELEGTKPAGASMDDIEEQQQLQGGE